MVVKFEAPETTRVQCCAGAAHFHSPAASYVCVSLSTSLPVVEVAAATWQWSSRWLGLLHHGNAYTGRFLLLIDALTITTRGVATLLSWFLSCNSTNTNDFDCKGKRWGGARGGGGGRGRGRGRDRGRDRGRGRDRATVTARVRARASRHPARDRVEHDSLRARGCCPATEHRRGGQARSL